MIKPIGDRVLVKPIEQTNLTDSGIYIAQKKRESIGKVVAVGDGIILENGTVIPLQVKPGDTVLYKDFAGHEIEVDEEKYLIMHEGEILAVLNSETE